MPDNVKRLLSPTSHKRRFNKARPAFRAYSITVLAFVRYFVLAALLVNLPAHAQRICGADGRTLEPEMVVLPAGSFRMGDIQGVGQSDEMPVHTVRIKSFAVGKYEVTQAQFGAFVEATGYNPSVCADPDGDWRDPLSSLDFNQPERHPVVCVSWSDARAYIAWLNGRTGKRYRLLTESEWEYAARAGTETRYYFGNSDGSLSGQANCSENSCSDGFEYTSPVGSFSPNGFGLYDMHGNVWEWVEDCAQVNYEGAPDDGSAVTSPCRREDQSQIRGGAWFTNAPSSLRSANRASNLRNTPSQSIGFRVARDL